MYIAIEGMDGVGKTTIAKLLSQKFNMEYIEKPMKKFMNCDEQYYNDLCNFMFGLENQDITLCFYMLGNIVTKYLGENIIVDRNILSSYFWDCNEKNKNIFDYFLPKAALPNLTIILYADVSTRIERIKNRNINDGDLENEITLKDGYEKMVNYAEELNIPYILIDTNNMDLDEVLNTCSDIIEKIIQIDKSQIYSICDEYKKSNKGPVQLLKRRFD